MKKLAGAFRLFAFFILSLSAMAIQSVAMRFSGRFRHRVPHNYFRLVARLLRMLSGVYDQAARSAASL